MLTYDFHTDQKVLTRCFSTRRTHNASQCTVAHWVCYMALSLICLWGSLVELVCDYKWARGWHFHSQSGWRDTDRRQRNTGGTGATVMSHAGWVNNQGPACSRWCLLEFKQSRLLTPQQGELLQRQKRFRRGKGPSEVDRPVWKQIVISIKTKE